MRVSSLESVGKEIVCRQEMLWDHIVGVSLSSACDQPRAQGYLRRSVSWGFKSRDQIAHFLIIRRKNRN